MRVKKLRLFLFPECVSMTDDAASGVATISVTETGKSFIALLSYLVFGDFGISFLYDPVLPIYLADLRHWMSHNGLRFNPS